MAVPSRLNTSAEVIADVTAVGIMEDATSSPGVTTLNGAIAAGTRTVIVTSDTNFTAGDKMRIGDRPLIEAGVLESKATVTFTMQSDIQDAYASGEAVVEVIDTPIGDLTEDGIEIAHDGGDTAIQSGTHRGAYTYIASPDQAITVNFSLLNMSLKNWAEAMGEDSSTRIAGAGSSADPYTLYIRENMFAEQPEKIWYFTGNRIDGTIIRVEANSAKVFSPSGSITFTQGSAAELPFALRVLHGISVQEYS